MVPPLHPSKFFSDPSFGFSVTTDHLPFEEQTVSLLSSDGNAKTRRREYSCTHGRSAIDQAGFQICPRSVGAVVTVVAPSLLRDRSLFIGWRAGEDFRGDHLIFGRTLSQ